MFSRRYSSFGHARRHVIEATCLGPTAPEHGIIILYWAYREAAIEEICPGPTVFQHGIIVDWARG